MNHFDLQILIFLNEHLARHPGIEKAVGLVPSTNLLQGGVMVLLVWLALFEDNRPGQFRKNFELLLGSIFFSLFATLVARGLALSLPFRERPIAIASLHVVRPAGSSMLLVDWSAFPSDHATLFFAIATGIFMVSRRIGWLALAWVGFICFALIALGAHWTTDIMVGAVLGISFAQLARVPAFREFVRRSTIGWYESHPQLFFAGLFLWSFETVILYDDVRRILMRIAHSIRI